MKCFNLLLLGLVFVIAQGTAQAQLGRIIGNAAKKTVERKAEQKTEKAVGDAIDKATDPDSYKEDNKDSQNNDSQNNSTNNNQQNPRTNSANDASDAGASNNASGEPAATKGAKSPEMAYNKFDFVSGDEIIFEDNMAGERVGEFPSKWDLMEGEAEIAKFNGENVIVMKKDCYIRPLMKNIKNYLGDVYTIEFDYWFTLAEEGKPYSGNYWIGLKPESVPWQNYSDFRLSMPGHIQWWWWRDRKTVKYEYSWKTPDKENREGHREEIIQPGSWVRISLSFNKRAMKIYVNENRIANIPNMAATNDWFSLWYGDGSDSKHGYIRNFRIAKGAVPLYDRMTTDGKIISYGITFDVGKSTIKPESMGELNRIVELMKENPELKFSVEGHTDNTGNAATNQTLSDARSQAVVDKLVEMGISKDRLKSAGKGQTAPIADNSTDEGRAKNRRVEFVKI